MTDFLQNIGWLIDLPDIFLVAFIVYRVLLLFKETLSHRFVIVLAALLVLSPISRLAGFHAVNWILDNLFGSIIIIHVVIFQHDIRIAFVALRRNRLGDLPSRDEAYEVIESWLLRLKRLPKEHRGFDRIRTGDAARQFHSVGTETTQRSPVNL
jgi:DNA integrity scanning protein DisA with diadenylate cyclase activity